MFTIDSSNAHQFFLAAQQIVQVNIPHAAKTIVTEIAEVMQNAAIQHYRDNKLSPGASRLIVGSFTLEPTKELGAMVYQARVYAGGHAAPYAVYVDLGWTKEDQEQKGHFEGHHFMQAGFDAGYNAAIMIVAKNFESALIHF